MTSVLKLIALDPAVPDHTTLSRWDSKPRAPNKRPGDRIPEKGPVYVLIDSTGLKIYGAGQWLEEKHGAKPRRDWRKLPLALGADSGEIIGHSLTDQEIGDISQLEPLLDQIDDQIGQLPPMEPVMALPPTRRFSVTAQAQGSSFHRARTRLSDPTPTCSARETAT